MNQYFVAFNHVPSMTVINTEVLADNLEDAEAIARGLVSDECVLTMSMELACPKFLAFDSSFEDLPY